METLMFALVVIGAMCIMLGVAYPIFVIIYEKLIKRSKKTIKEIMEEY